MTTLVHVTPGRVVKIPAGNRTRTLPDTGFNVNERDPFWAALLRNGDLTAGDVPAQAAASTTTSAKATAAAATTATTPAASGSATK
ncbi:hypothetical protein CFR78_04225 [Komagataeibacter rhaeticus]|uniref:hypothetical protein n=1 Tax=Komagataeibacter rhaeticus TaxID=215221 RepID=UPI0004D49D7C|nr:hypothetical protein [Komagataeibacter rhaeticus]KDU96458.1 hypothetical protein GLUCORHAEAF1_01695 [Komagataeibacter rhaeticus AF1]PYD54182.1 hypothetical protein CFR78_04225 [Komagataeibacter rhaeticus]GBQ15252.1 hypothetical protein AA16663_2035 [Komagataeibacter rhaeticus DSM 16663]